MSVVEKQLDAIEAQLEVLKVMVAGMRHALSTPRAVERQLPETCRPSAAEECARRNPEAAASCGGMGGGVPQVMCRGCGLMQG